MEKYFILGLDLGIASIGWCLFEGDKIYTFDENGEIFADKNDEPIAIHQPKRIVDLGSFIFENLEDNKGRTENQKRGVSRRIRRQRRRKVHRLERLRDLFKDEFNIDFLNDVIQNRDKYTKKNPFEIKVFGLENKLSKEEIMIALYHYMKYRGFKSNRKSADKNNSDSKKLLGLITNTQKVLEERSLTITQYLLASQQERINNSDSNNRIHNRESNEPINNMNVNRDMYLCEINSFLDKQIEYGVITEEFKNKYLYLYNQQRTFSEGPGFESAGVLSKYHVDFSKMRGNCIFDKQPRAVKDSITAKRFVLLSSLNNFRYKFYDDVRYRSLTSEQIRIAEKEIIFKKEYKYSSLIKLLNLNEVEVKGLSISKKVYKNLYKDFIKKHNIEKLNNETRPLFDKEVEKKKLDSLFFKGSVLIDTINKSKANIFDGYRTDDKFYNDLSEILFANKDDENIKSALLDKGYSEEIADAILELNVDCKQVIDLSYDICNKVSEKLREGMTYDKALKEIGYDHRGSFEKNLSFNGIPPIDKALEIMNVKLNNPVVKNCLVNLRKVINAIIKKYGPIDECVIELNRELKKPFSERTEIRNNQLESYQDNLSEKLYLVNKYPNVFNSVVNVNKDSLIRFKLFKEQKEISPYSDEKIKESNLFTDEYEVDHIMPYSLSFDDSFNNKVLVERSNNRLKGARLPFEVGGDLFSNVKSFLNATPEYSRQKRDNLLRNDIPDEFKLRNLNDTSYLTKIARDLISRFVLQSGVCRSSNGRITDLLRKSWNLNGKTHTYAVDGNGNNVSYENNLYQARYDLDYKFEFLEIKSSKDNCELNFVFNTKKNIGVKIENVPFSVLIKTGKGKTDEDKIRNEYIHDFFESYDLMFTNHFRKGMTVGDILDEIKDVRCGDKFTTEQYKEHLDSAKNVLTSVLGQIQKDIDEKNRENDLHHALDAAVIGMTTTAIYQKTSRANKLDILDDMKFEEPYKDFRKEVLARVYERDVNKLREILKNLTPYKDRFIDFRDIHVLVPVKQPKTRIEGALSKETIYGVSKANKNLLTKKISVFKLKKEDIELIIDKESGNKAVYDAVKEQFSKEGGKITKYPVLRKKSNYVKFVKILHGNVDEKVPLSREGNRFADNDNIVRVELYKKKDSDSDILYAVPVYYYQLINRKKNLPVNYTIMWKQGSEGSKLIDSETLKEKYNLISCLPRYSLVEIEKYDGKKTLVYTGGVTHGQIEIYSLIGDFLDLAYIFNSKIENSRMRLTISTIKSIKVKNISILGKIS